MSAIELLKRKVEWGMEIDRNHLFDYGNIRDMIAEAEQRAQQEGQR